MHTDYYAGGQAMPGRNWVSGSDKYRYSHNGHEREDVIFEGAQSAEFWMYDSRILRRWERDPIINESQSPYACFNGNPIWYNDPLGLKGEDPIKKGQTVDLGGGQSYVASSDEVVVTPNNNPANSPPTINQNANNNQQIAIPNTQQQELGNRNKLPKITGVLPNTAWRTQAPNWTECFTTCKNILKNNGIQNPAPKNLAIQMTTENNTRNGLNVAATANQGLTAINGSLDQKEPIIVGVNHTFGNNYNEGTTDHFIVIVGRGYQEGRLYYRFFDVGTTRANAGTHQQNRLYLTNNNTLVGITQYNQKRYTVSQVRPNRK